MENLSGRMIKGYQLMERIGAGAFGAVYRAYQSTVGREVALKIILPGFANHPSFIRRFEMEAQLIARLEHIHMVTLYDYWRDPSGAYLAMRWLRGGSLKEAIQERPFSVREAARLMDQVGSAMAAAHRNDIVHRDLKPSNILLDEEGNAYLADFGIALDTAMQAGSAAETEPILGSPAYLSPEQARRELVTPRSDIYSLGVTLYEMLTGKHPFAGASALECLYKHINEALPPIETLDPEIQEGVNEIVQKATAKNPRQRYQDIFEMVAAFQEAVHLGEDGQNKELVESLTPREQQILGLIVQGRTNKQIAQALFVEASTVKWYITQIYRKMGVRSRVQAMVRARELDLIQPGGDSPAAGAGAHTIEPGAQMPPNPYKGLRAFEAADSRDFYGREVLTKRLVNRLGEEDYRGRFLAIVSPSGSGKSSLVKAGLIPALHRGALPGSEDWFIVAMTPGSRPLEALEVALTRVSADMASNIHGQLESGERGLLRVAGLILPNDGSDLLIVIDQFEDLFSLVEEEAARRHFLDLLYAAVTDSRSRVRVVITLRADFYDRPLHYADFGELLRRRMETVLPLSAEELERAIRRPAESVGIRFEPGLVATIIDEINYQPGALPLLQYALTELFENRQHDLLSYRAYRDIGGAAGALARRAEEIYQDLSEEGRKTARQLFLRLVSTGDVGGDGQTPPNTGQRALRSNLMAIAPDGELMDEVIDTFAAYRLLSLNHDPATRSPTVELAHDALLREWDRLRAWLEESREDLRQQRRLGLLSQEWLQAGREASFVLRGARLEGFERWAASTDLAQTTDEQAYLQASLAEREVRHAAEAARQVHEAKLERRSRNFLRALVAVLLVATLASLALAGSARRSQTFAEAETIARATAEADALRDRDVATSRELALAALNNLETDPERSILLALQALSVTYTQAAEEALHGAMQSSRVRQSFPGFTSAYSPDGKFLATGLQDGSIKVWEVDSGREVLGWPRHTKRVNALAYSPDGSRLASASEDGVAKVWDASTGENLLTFLGHVNGSNGPAFTSQDTFLNSIAFSPDGARLVTAGTDDTVRVWDAYSGEEQIRLVEPSGGWNPGNGAIFSPDGKYLATDNINSQLKIWDASGEQLLLEMPGAQPIFSPDGAWLAGVSEDSLRVVVWDFEKSLAAGSGQLLFELPGHKSLIFAMAFSPDGTRLASAGLDGTAILWSLGEEGGEALITLSGHMRAIADVDFSLDGARLATGADDGVRIWDLSASGTAELLAFPGHGDLVSEVDISQDGKYLATASMDGTAKVWDLTDGQLLFDLLGHTDRVVDVSFSPDGRLLATAGTDNTARTWDFAASLSAGAGQPLLALSGHRDAPPIGGLFPGVSRVNFSPDGQLLVTAGADGTARVWEVHSGREVLVLSGHPNGNGVTNAIFSPDGTRLATATDSSRIADTVVKVWDFSAALKTGTGTGRDLLSLSGFPDRVWGLAFSPDGRRLATSTDYVAEVWDLDTGLKNFTLSGHTSTVIDIKFSPDGSLLATAGGDGTTKLWEAATGQELFTFTNVSGLLNRVDFTPDSKYLAISGPDWVVRLYAVELEQLVALAKSRVTRSLTTEECRLFLHLDQCPSEP